MSRFEALCLAAVVAGGATLACSRANLDVLSKMPGDAGTPDVKDAGLRDSGTPDMGTPDMGTPDKGTPDMGTPDTADAAPVSCPSTVLKAGDTTQTVRVGSATRSYVLHVPSAYDGSKPVPLILDFHASGGSGSFENSVSLYPAVTDGEGVVMAFPTGLAGPMGTAWNMGPCCVASSVDDLGFARALVAQVETLACIDPKRVYAVGPLTGGGMAYYLACNAADLFAAVAPAGFDMFQETSDACRPSRHLTVISFRGTKQTLVPYGGGPSSFVPGMPVTFLGAQETFQKWGQLDQCSGSASSPDSNGCSAYPSCQDSAEVILCTKQDGGDDVGNPSLAWSVLKRHRLP